MHFDVFGFAAVVAFGAEKVSWVQCFIHQTFGVKRALSVKNHMRSVGVY